MVDPSEAEAIMWTEPLDGPGLADTLAGAPGVRWVQLPFVGVDAFLSIIDDSRTWTSAKGAYSEPVAEHALALGLAGLRLLPTRARATEWGEQAGRRLMDGRVTIVGGGGIAEALLRLLAPFRVDTTVVRRHQRPVAGADRVLTVDRLHDALPGADLVVLALSLTPETEGIIGAAELDLMEPHAWLVNVARGRHVVTDDLVAALRRRSIGGAALDVTEPEPLPADHPLWDPRQLPDHAPHGQHVGHGRAPLRPPGDGERGPLRPGRRAPRPGQPPPGLLRAGHPVSRPARGRCTGGRP